MKKLMGLALSAALLYSSGPASAELLKNLKVGGQIDMQAVSANNVTDFNTSTYDQIGDAQTRVMLNVGWDLLDDVHSMVTLRKNNRVYSAGSENVNGIQGVIWADQAYFKIDKVFGAIDSTFGRQFFGTPGDAVIYFGPHDNLYGLAVSALDMARFDWDTKYVGLTGVVGKIASPGGQGGATSEIGAIDVRGINAAIKGNDMLNGSVYVYERVTHRSIAGANPAPNPSSTPNDNLWVMGLRGKLSKFGGWLKAEYDQNMGQNRAAGIVGTNYYTGWQFLADIGYKADIANVGGITPWFNYGIGSGGATANRTFTSIAGDYKAGGIYSLFAPASVNAAPAPTPATLGQASGVGTVSTGNLGNRVNWGLGFKVNPAALNKLTAGLSWWDYSYQSVLGTPGAARGNKHIGYELDLDLNWAHSDNVGLGIGLGMFQPGGAINNSQTAIGVNPVSLAKMNVQVKF